MIEPKLNVNLVGIEMKNPIMTASGTYGYGKEYLPFFTPDTLGAVVTKGVALTPWDGNPPPRVYETPSGMLNAIGLQNPGVEVFIKEALPFLAQYDVPVIVNIVGKSIADYVGVAERLNEFDGISGFELNISCPNVKEGGIAFGVDPKAAAEITSAVREATSKKLIVKLSPNVSDITKIAKAVEDSGADAISLINTLLGMAIDVNKRQPILANTFGGLSGPAVKPVALRMVYQVYNAVSIPLIGMGGITSAKDVLEFIMAGAQAVSIGSGLFANPELPLQILNDLKQFMLEKGISDINDLVGVAHR